MGILTGAEKKMARKGDRISSLPDDVLGDIVSLLPTKDGARTQILSSRWRHLWRSAALNFDLQDMDQDRPRTHASEVSRILSAHPGPCRRLVVPCRFDINDHPVTATLDEWLRCPALGKLQELHCYYYTRFVVPSLRRFSSTLRVVSVGSCIFSDGNNGGGALLLPVLESLTLSNVTISGSALHALLAGCPALQSFELTGTDYVSSPLQIVSSSLRSIRVFSYLRRFELVIEDAPCLERIHCSENTNMGISIISAPRLVVLGELCDNSPRLRFGTTFLRGFNIVTMGAAVHSVKVLSLSWVDLSLDSTINLLKCFPHLEILHIKARSFCAQNAWYQTNPERIGTLNIRVRKIVLKNYQGSKPHVDFVNFFLSNARELELVELWFTNISTNWCIARQHGQLNIKSGSTDPRVTFVSHN